MTRLVISRIAAPQPGRPHHFIAIVRTDRRRRSSPRRRRTCRRRRAPRSRLARRAADRSAWRGQGSAPSCDAPSRSSSTPECGGSRHCSAPARSGKKRCSTVDSGPPTVSRGSRRTSRWPPARSASSIVGRGVHRRSSWNAIAGMSDLQRVIEEHVVRPILEDELARPHGLHGPATVTLFGPPGTGTTALPRPSADDSVGPSSN